MSNFEYISISIQTLLLIGGLYLTFFKSYFSEKGKNLATKEDIEAITSKVEAIKTEFIKETERLKQDLQFENHLKITFNSEYKNSIIQTYESFHAWLELIYHIYTISVDCPLSKFKGFEKEMDTVSAKYGAAFAKLELYTDSKEMISVIHRLNLITTDFQNNVDKYLFDMQYLREDEEALDQEIEQMIDNGLKVSENLNREWDEIQDKIKKVYNKCGEDFKDEYEKILSVNMMFMQLCKDVIVITKPLDRL